MKRIVAMALITAVFLVMVALLGSPGAVVAQDCTGPTDPQTGLDPQNGPELGGMPNIDSCVWPSDTSDYGPCDPEGSDSSCLI